MTAFVPTHLVDVLRGTATDSYGDQVDADAIAAYGAPCSIVEKSRREREPVSGTPRTVRYLRARFRPGAGIRDGDRLRDCADATIYLVGGVNVPTDLVGAADVLCDLTRVTGSG